MASHNNRKSFFPGSGEESMAVKPLREQLAPSRDNNIFPGLAPVGKANHRRRRERILPVSPLTSRNTEPVTILEGSPWDFYRMSYRLDLGGSLAVVRRQPATKELFTIRSFTGDSVNEKLALLRQLRHDNLLASHQIFSFQGVYFVISECMAISLEELTIARPDELQLATIIHQVLEGISFFISHELTHGAITRQNILLSSKGEVKIANPECCHRSAQSRNSEDILALGRLMKQLMEGGPDGTLGLQRPELWSEEAVDFVSMAMSASSEQLAQHPFLRDAPRTEELVWLVSLAQVSAYRFYKYGKLSNSVGIK